MKSLTSLFFYRPPERGTTSSTRTALPCGNLCYKSWAQDEQWQDQIYVS